MADDKHEQKDGVWVPHSYKRKQRDIAREDVAQFLRDNKDQAEDLFKSARGNEAAPFPHKMVETFALLGYYNGITEPQKATQQSFKLLRKVGDSHIVRTIVSTRARQLKRYCYPSEDNNQPGFKIEMADPESEPTQGDRERMQTIMDWLLNGGFRTQRPYDNAWGVYSGDYVFEGQPLPDMMTGIIRDMLTIDAGALWTPPGKNEQEVPVAMMYPLDGALIRKTLPKIPAYQNPSMPADAGVRPGMSGSLSVGMGPYDPKLREDKKLIEYIMLHPDQQHPKNNEDGVLAEFAHGELEYIVRNHRTEWWTMGYGHSELESCLQIVAGALNAIAYNTSIFTNSNIPPGILSMHGNYGEDWMMDFAQTLVQNVGGQNKWHKLPLIFGDADSSMQYQPLRDGSSDDIMWREFLIFVVNLLCAQFHIAAEEINFQSFLTRGGVMTGQGGAERVAFAQETGLHDLIRHVFSVLNRAIVRRFWADDETGLGPYRIVPTGVGDDDSELEHQQRMDRMNTGYTSVNEERRAGDKPPFRDPVDAETWERVKQRALQRDPSLESDPQRLDDVVAAAYRELDGELRRWPELPHNPSMQQARSQEMQEEQGEEGMMPPGMEGMMGPPGPGGEQMPPPGGPQPPGAGEAPPQEAQEAEQPPGPEDLMKLPIPVEKSLNADDSPPGWRAIDIVLHEQSERLNNSRE